MKKGIDFNVEALRGFCALMVLVHHFIIFSNVLNPGFDFRSKIVPYTPSGHLMVLIFFMLSGYVIGITSLKRDNFEILGYLKKRLVRLYPIYLIIIAITITLFTESWQSILGTAFFTQNVLVNVLTNNNALWSLNHEIVYYILVIPILFFKIKPSAVLFLLVLLLSLSSYKLGFPGIIVSYLVGFIFWITGFAVSKIKLEQIETLQVTPDKLISLFFLLLACDFLNVFQVSRVFSKLHLLYGVSIHRFDTIVNIDDFSGFPFCLYAIVIASSTKIKWQKLLTMAVYFFCWAHLIYLTINGSFFKTDIFYLPAVFLVLSTIMYFIPVKIFKSVSLWISVGSISYAMYAIHMPLLNFMGKIDFFKGSTQAYFCRVTVLFAVAILLAYLLEKIVQPRIKVLFDAKQTKPAVGSIL